LKTNINKITQYVTKRITEIGYDVYISYSDKSRSRYLEINLSKERKIIVRISNHPSARLYRRLYKFDIHTSARRKGSLDYVEFIDAFKQIVGKNGS